MPIPLAGGTQLAQGAGWKSAQMALRQEPPAGLRSRARRLACLPLAPPSSRAGLPQNRPWHCVHPALRVSCPPLRTTFLPASDSPPRKPAVRLQCFDALQSEKDRFCRCPRCSAPARGPTTPPPERLRPQRGRDFQRRPSATWPIAVRRAQCLPLPGAGQHFAMRPPARGCSRPSPPPRAGNTGHCHRGSVAGSHGLPRSGGSCAAID